MRSTFNGQPEISVFLCHQKNAKGQRLAWYSSASNYTRLKWPRDYQKRKCRSSSIFLDYGRIRNVVSRELQSLVGKLNHACAVMPQGRTFMRRLLDLLRGTNQSRTFIRLNKACREDIAWWLASRPSWSGINFFDLPDWSPLPDLSVSSDASGSKGFGAIYAGQWFQGYWSPSQQHLTSSFMG